MTARLRGLVILIVLAAGCESDDRPASFVIPGPTGPSAVPTGSPYVWDTREELSVWVENQVSRGSFTVEGSGTEAFIRITLGDSDWVLRGPDLSPAPAGVRGAAIRYRWQLDPSLPANASRFTQTVANFQTRSAPPSGNGQVSARASFEPRDAFTDQTLTLSQPPAIDVEYLYLTGYGFSRGVLEIDRIALVR